MRNLLLFGIFHIFIHHICFLEHKILKLFIQKAFVDTFLTMINQKNAIFFTFFLLFFQKITHKTNNEPRLTYMNNFIGSLSIQNMGIDTKIRPLALM